MASGLQWLVDVCYSSHFRIHYGAKEFSRDDNCHINSIESF